MPSPDSCEQLVVGHRLSECSLCLVPWKTQLQLDYHQFYTIPDNSSYQHCDRQDPVPKTIVNDLNSQAGGASQGGTLTGHVRPLFSSIHLALYYSVTNSRSRNV